MPQNNEDTRPIEVADIFRLAKAMPSGPDMPGILLELSRIAEETGIEFQSVTPAASEVVGGFQNVPITLAFDGNFYELSDFLFRLRTLVGVRAGELRAAGRLFAVESISFAESPKGFPELVATLSVVAYVYGTDAPASAGAPPAATTPPADPNARHRGRSKCGDTGTCTGRDTNWSGGESLMAKRVDPLMAKKAKQKKLAIVLSVLLVGVVAFQGPKMLKMMKGPRRRRLLRLRRPRWPRPPGGAAVPDPLGARGRADAGRRARRLRRRAGRGERPAGLGRELLDQGSVRPAAHRDRAG